MTALSGLSWTEAANLISHGVVAILPVGSIEAHGPHLPLSTDIIISGEMSRRAADELAGRGINAVVLPALQYSVTEFSADFPGTISIASDTASALIRDICVSLYRQGVRLVAIANSHLEPGHVDSINTAVREVESVTGKRVVFPDKRRKPWALRLTEEFRRGDCHAGSYETSLVMAAQPELVNESIRRTLEPIHISISEQIRRGATTFKQAGGEQAYFGDPRSATREEGEKTFGILSEMLVESILEGLKQEETSPERTNP